MIWVGEKGRDIFQTWSLSSEEEKKLKTYYDRFEAYVKPKSNKVFARYKFHKKVQVENESYQQFVTELKLLVKDCGYADPDEMVRDRIVIGCLVPKVRERLIEEGSDLKLEKAIEIGLTMEMSRSHMTTIAEEDLKVQAIKASQFKQREKPQNRQYTRNTTSKDAEPNCGNCGYKHYNKDSQCPAKGKRCNKCSRYNHFGSVCKSANNNGKVQEIEEDEEENHFFVGYVEHVNSVSVSDWQEKLEINGNQVTVLLDTGAKCNVIPIQKYNSLGLDTPIQPTKAKLRSYTGHNIEVYGKTTLECKHKENTYMLNFYVAKTNGTTILSAQTCKDLQLIQRVNQVAEHKPLPDILKEYPDVLKGLGCLPGKHTIKVDPSVKPVIHPPRRVPIALKDKIKEELDRMEREGVIVRQMEPTAWVNSMVTVVKPNKVRICIDPKDLNQAIQREHFPMKTIEEIVADMPDAKVFSVLDATSGFWQVQLDEESSNLCTFNSPYGRYRFTRLPFGIKSAPEVFQRHMSEMLEGIPGAQPITGASSIVDDILVWGTTVEEHDARLRQVLDRARKYNLKFNSKKCRIRQQEVPYVGHLITSEGLKPDPEKVRAVLEMKAPQSVKELRTFLGFIQYLGKFLPNLSTESAPLRQLLEKEIAWHWNQEQEQSFNKLKQMISTAPVLGYFNPTKPVTLSVDASAKGIGAVILQEDKPIAYASRAMTTAQQKYAQIEKELLAIVYGCQKFHQYVYGRTVSVESDHKPLESIMTKNLYQAPMRLQKMMLSLQKYDLKVKYKPGINLQLADTLSRAYLPETQEVLVEDLHVNELCISSHLPMSREKYTEFQKSHSRRSSHAVTD
jgi:hypothetical protein